MGVSVTKAVIEAHGDTLNLFSYRDQTSVFPVSPPLERGRSRD
jgi:hypothetical protein